MSENQSAVLLSDVLNVANLHGAISDGLISVREHTDGSTHLLNYTAKAQYTGSWTTETLTCRGLIISRSPYDENARVLARPFAKFANASEHHENSPFGALPTQRPFEVYEKLDGSLAIGYNTGDGLRFATRGSFVSEQAEAATRLWRERYGELEVPAGVTVLFEYVAPWNRIVVNYDEENLILLGGITIATGADVDLTGWNFPGPRAKRFDGLQQFNEVVRYLEEHDTATAEGFVVRFVPEHPTAPSLRVKVKFAEYLRLHKVVSGVSNVSVYEHLAAGGTLGDLLELLPDEFHAFVGTTGKALLDQHRHLVDSAALVARRVEDLPRKEAAAVTLAQRDVPASLVFATLDDKDVSSMVWRLLRPAFAARV